MFEIKNLTIFVEGRKESVVKNFSLIMKSGEIHALMGPNGAGKSSIAHALMGNKKYKTFGKLLLNGIDIAKLKPDERARNGLFLAFQNPEEIEGVSTSILLRKAHSLITGERQTIEEILKIQKEIEENAKSLGLAEEFIRRSANVGFSGGEKKRSEILQLSVLKSKIIILDEIDSGLDVDGVRSVAKQLKKLKDKRRSFLIITHQPRILKYLKPNFVHIMINGKLVKSGRFKLAKEIEKRGYMKYLVS